MHLRWGTAPTAPLVTRTARWAGEVSFAGPPSARHGNCEAIMAGQKALRGRLWLALFWGLGILGCDGTEPAAGLSLRRAQPASTPNAGAVIGQRRAKFPASVR